MPTPEFNQSAIDRAKGAGLVPYQSNLMARTDDGSEVHAIWVEDGFVDYDLGYRINGVVDFWPDHRFPVGGFMPGCRP